MFPTVPVFKHLRTLGSAFELSANDLLSANELTAVWKLLLQDRPSAKQSPCCELP